MSDDMLARSFAPTRLLDRVPGHGRSIGIAGEQAIEAARLAARDIAAVAVQGPSGQIHQFRVAIVHGSVALASIGGHRGRRELVAGGEAVEQAQQRVTQARPGDRGCDVPLGTGGEPAAGADPQRHHGG